MADPSPIKMFVSVARYCVEPIDPTAGITVATLIQIGICSIPKRCETETQAFFREDVKIEIPDRSIGRLRNEKALHFVLFIGPYAKPHITDEAIFAKRAEANSRLGEALFEALWRHRQEGKHGISSIDLTYFKSPAKSGCEYRGTGYGLNHELIKKKPKRRPTTKKNPLEQIKHTSNKAKLLDRAYEFGQHIIENSVTSYGSQVHYGCVKQIAGATATVYQTAGPANMIVSADL